MRNVNDREMDRLFNSLSGLLSHAYAARGSVAAVAGEAQYLTVNVRELAALVADMVDDVDERLKRLNVLLSELQMDLAI